MPANPHFRGSLQASGLYPCKHCFYPDALLPRLCRGAHTLNSDLFDSREIHHADDPDHPQARRRPAQPDGPHHLQV
jgi:hypothetical protein